MDNVNTYKVNKEAVKKIAEKVYDNGSTVINRNDLEEMFPELKDDEDERIRKEMIEILEKEAHDFPSSVIAEKSNSWIAWLKKQGEKGTIGNEREIFYSEQKLDIVQTLKNYFATTSKEQQDKDFEELKHLNEFGGKLVQPKTAWSEEDEMFVHGLIRGLAAKKDIHGHTTFSSDCIDITETINWLKDLKDRYTWKPSDEQINALAKNVEYVNVGCTQPILKGLLEQLKKLMEE